MTIKNGRVQVSLEGDGLDNRPSKRSNDLKSAMGLQPIGGQKFTSSAIQIS